MANNDIIPGFDEQGDDSCKIRLKRITETPRCLLLTLAGYIDTYNSNFFQKRVQKAIESGYVRLIFQCSSLNYVSSTGIGLFTAVLKEVKSRGGDLVLLDIQPKVYDVFQLLGFSQFFNIKYNMDDSIHFFNSDQDKKKTSVFPKTISCPVCYKKLRAIKSGHFRCSQCKCILAIDKAGQVLLG